MTYEREVKSRAFFRYSVRAEKKKNRRVNGREVWLGVVQNDDLGWYRRCANFGEAA